MSSEEIPHINWNFAIKLYFLKVLTDNYDNSNSVIKDIYKFSIKSSFRISFGRDYFRLGPEILFAEGYWINYEKTLVNILVWK